MQLDRDEPGVAVAIGAERPGPSMSHSAPQPPKPLSWHCQNATAVRVAAGVGERRRTCRSAPPRPGPASPAERADDEIDQHRQRRIVRAHRRGRPRADDRALRQDQLERAERAFVGVALGQEQIAEREARHGRAAAAAARVHRRVDLRRQRREIDRHLVAVDDHRDLAGQRSRD